MLSWKDTRLALRARVLHIPLLCLDSHNAALLVVPFKVMPTARLELSKEALVRRYGVWRGFGRGHLGGTSKVFSITRMLSNLELRP